MEKVTMLEVLEKFRGYNKQHGLSYGGVAPKDVPVLKAVIVYKQSNFKTPYPVESRSYRVNNFSGKAFFFEMLGRSIFGDCLDGSEEYLRLDVQNWEIEYCYFENDEVPA